MNTSTIHDLVRARRLSPEAGAQLLAIRRERRRREVLRDLLLLAFVIAVLVASS